MSIRKLELILTFLLFMAVSSGCNLQSVGNTRMIGGAAEPGGFTQYRQAGTGLTCQVPADWVEYSPGQFQPDPGSDPTLLDLAAFPGVTLEQVKETWQPPDLSETLDAGELRWEIYKGEVDIPDAGSLTFVFSLAESEHSAYLISLITSVDKESDLRQNVLIPVLRSVAAQPAALNEFSIAIDPATEAESAPPVDTRTRQADGMELVYVPEGRFTMGSDGTQWVWNGSMAVGDLGLQVYTDESPAHDIYLDAYWIDRTEVTVAMFRAFVEETGFITTAEREGWGAPWTNNPQEDEWPHVPGTDWRHPHGPDSAGQAGHPVVQVTWDDAAAYCAWAGGSLPTEAQWEKAARGTDGRWWPWGNVFDSGMGNFCDENCPVDRQNDHGSDDGYALTAPVGSFPTGASTYGAFDMAGNVWEWTADWYDEDSYTESAYENPTGPSFGTERVQRGGAWYDNGSWVRTTVRHSTPGWMRFDDLGFRCVLPAEAR
ncbi:MAG: formylglycine-generating enzyme family protein [Anaerolineales bacterium]|nr:formylglycine-generating enzyme family protein [Anaerolineales bacterium]